MAPALHRLGRVCRAEGRSRPPRRRLRQHRPPDRHGVSRRLGGVHHGLARGQRGGVRPARTGRRRRLGAPVQRVHGATPTSRSGSSRRSFGRPRASRSAARRCGGSAAAGCSSSPGNTLVSCRDWVTDDVRVRGGPRRPRPLGAPHGPRPGSGDVRLHDAGDRRRAAARRDAGAGGRRRPPRRGACGDRHRRGRRGAPRGRRPSGSSSRTGGPPASGSRTARSSPQPAPSSPTSRRRSSTERSSAAPTSLRPSPRAAARFRYGRAEMQIHLALDEPPRGREPRRERLGRCPIVHVTSGLDGVSRAVNEAERGLLPAEATIVCGQPVALDPSRAPAGKSILWIQLQELPAGAVKGDAAGELDTGDGTWTEDAARGVCRPDRRPARRVDRESRHRRR